MAFMYLPKKLKNNEYRLHCIFGHLYSFKLGFTLSAQEFSFYLHFEDALGNKVSVLLGYDTTATNGLDSQWDETNLIDQPWGTDFEVRVTNCCYRKSSTELDAFQTKIWITYNYKGKDSINGNVGLLGQLAIKSKSFPITIRFDSDLFQDSYRYGSFLTCVVPGGWWDVGGCGALTNGLERVDKILFSQDSLGRFDKSCECYNNSNRFITSEGDTLYYFWFSFSPENIGVSTKFLPKPISIKLKPNPVVSSLILESPQLNKSAQFKIMDIQGRIFLNGQYSKVIDVSILPPGIYSIDIFDSKNRWLGKFIKQ